MKKKPPDKGMKYCSKCKTFRAIDCFGKNRSRPDCLAYWCKGCQSTYMDKTKERRISYHKKYYEKHREYYIKKANERHKTNPEKQREYNRKSYKKWSKANPDKIREINRRKRSSVKGRIGNNISRSIRKSLRNGYKKGHHWEDIVGYTVTQLKRHLEKMFTSEMTWANYGLYWNIDHKIPIAAFNFEIPTDSDFKKCWSLKNLQPLESAINFRKGARLNQPFQPELMI